MRKSRRIPLIDSLRGLALICMIAVHLLYDLKEFFGLPITLGDAYWDFNLCLGGTFTLISGVSIRLGSKALKRGIIVFCCGLLITAATFFVGGGNEIYFGILHLLGVSMIIYHFSRRFFERIKPLVGFPLWSSCFLVLQLLLYQKIWLFKDFFWLGLPNAGFYSADYYPLIPWFFLFLAGCSLGEAVKNGRLPGWFYTLNIKFLSFTGRHSLPIYLLHQPVLLALLSMFLP